MRIIPLFVVAFCVACNTVTTPQFIDTATPQAVGIELKSSRTKLKRPELLKLNATAPTGTARVEFYRDGKKVGEDSSAPFALELTYAKVQTATQAFTAKSFDANNATKTSNTVTVEIEITGKIWYVSPSGSDSNDGSSESKAFKTMQRGVDSLQPGHTVLVMNGTYSDPKETNNIVYFAKNGTAEAWVALMAYPGHSPKLQVRNWTGIGVSAAYVLIQGFTLEGNRDDITLDYALSERNNLNNPLTSGSCIGVISKFDIGARAHHVVIRGNTVSKCPGGGIYTYWADYVTVEDNVIYANAYYAPYANSGLSFYQNWNSDSSPNTKIFARRNLIYGNRNLVPFYYSNSDPAKRVITDGNGIIVDDSRHTQGNAGLGAYKGRVLIENNVVYENGGRGIHVYSSDRVDIRHNTTFKNSFQPETPEGEITAIEAGDVQVFNNLASARSDRPSITRYAKTAAEKASQVFENNLIFGGTKFDADSSKNLVGVDPKFVDKDAKNFRIQSTSPAVDAGNATRSSARDFVQVARPRGAGVDIGAFEVR
jgi:parallel beta-helix repeat protein